MQNKSLLYSSDSHDAEEISFQKGFTLVELMISLLLGSLIAAAAFQVFYISQRTATTQRSASAVQDSAVFGLNTLERQLKLANLGASSSLNSSTPNGGVVLDAKNAPSLTDDKTYTKQGVQATPSIVGGKSDQLTIQFAVPPGGITDCEGQSIASPPNGSSIQLVQRYYLRDGDLYCDSNLSPKSSPAFGGNNGTSIISGVDQFRVLLITADGFKAPDDYNGTSAIHGVKLGFVFSGATPTIEAQGAVVPKLFGEELKLSPTATNTIRRTYEPTILFRNARL